MITSLHEQKINSWKKQGIELSESGLLELVEQNHNFNYQLWHTEDKARRDDKGFEFVYKAKRLIDGYNQQRNNFMEKIDLWIFTELHPSTEKSCPVHSETPGMIIDRLSILSLKEYHMDLQTKRSDVDDKHINACKEKLSVIKAQKAGLKECLQNLLDEISANTRTFRLYNQFKMYNDPSLNPELAANNQLMQSPVMGSSKL